MNEPERPFQPQTVNRPPVENSPDAAYPSSIESLSDKWREIQTPAEPTASGSFWQRNPTALGIAIGIAPRHYSGDCRRLSGIGLDGQSLKPFMQRHSIKLGLEVLLTEQVGLLRGARVGLICNPASVNHAFRHAADLFHEHGEINLTALYGPQHGIRGETQDNMIEWQSFRDSRTGVMADRKAHV